MRVTEILNEAGDADNNSPGKLKGKRAKLHPNHDAAIPSMRTLPDMAGMYYSMYRFGTHMAGSPDNPNHKEGPTANEMVTTAYTDADADIVNHTAKAMGMKIKGISSKGSKEVKDTNSVSTVAKIKRNKYGV